MSTAAAHFDRLSRPSALILALCGAVACADLNLLIVGFVTILGLSWAVGTLPAYVQFLLRIWLPLLVALEFVWGGLVGAAPGRPVGSARIDGVQYGLIIALRLAVISGLGQSALLALPIHKMVDALRFHLIPVPVIVVAVAARTLVVDLNSRLDQVWTARLARGVVGTPTLFQRLRHFPPLLRPLLAWTLRSAVQRSELWNERALLARIGGSQNHYSQSRPLSAGLLSLAVAWFISVIIFR